MLPSKQRHLRLYTPDAQLQQGTVGRPASVCKHSREWETMSYEPLLLLATGMAALSVLSHGMLAGKKNTEQFCTVQLLVGGH